MVPQPENKWWAYEKGEAKSPLPSDYTDVSKFAAFIELDGKKGRKPEEGESSQREDQQQTVHPGQQEIQRDFIAQHGGQRGAVSANHHNQDQIPDPPLFHPI